MSNSPTLKDLAKILGFSVSTVSKALNDSPEISEATKERVKSTAQKLNYIPNENARGLKSRKTFRIGVVVPNVKDDFFAKVIHAIEYHASINNYKLIICLSNDRLSKEQESIEFMLNGSVDGILISLAKETQDLNALTHLKKVQTKQIPMVMFDRVSNEVKADTVTIDDFNTTYKATMELGKLGLNNIAFLTTIGSTSVSHLRLNGYHSALKELQTQEGIVIDITNYDVFETQLAQELKTSRPDAIIAADQLSAICALKVIQNQGLRIPEDISVLGFTDGLIPQHTIPSLSTISQNASEMGRIALDILLRRMKYPVFKGYIHDIVDSTIIHRSSTLTPQE